jgi:hypothetical protein
VAGAPVAAGGEVNVSAEDAATLTGGFRPLGALVPDLAQEPIHAPVSEPTPAPASAPVPAPALAVPEPQPAPDPPRRTKAQIATDLAAARAAEAQLQADLAQATS